MDIQYVLCNERKTPLMKGWPELRPSAEQVRAHLDTPGNTIGVNPSSVEMDDGIRGLCIDCDRLVGDDKKYAAGERRLSQSDIYGILSELKSADAGFVLMETGGGYHIWVGVDAPIPKGRVSFEWSGVKGELIYGNGAADKSAFQTIIWDKPRFHEVPEITRSLPYSMIERFYPRARKAKNEPDSDKALSAIEYALRGWGSRSNAEWVSMFHAAYHGSNGDSRVRDAIVSHADVEWSDGEAGKQAFIRQWDAGISSGSAGLGTIIHLAKANGWKVPRKKLSSEARAERRSERANELGRLATTRWSSALVPHEFLKALLLRMPENFLLADRLYALDGLTWSESTEAFAAHMENYATYMLDLIDEEIMNCETKGGTEELKSMRTEFKRTYKAALKQKGHQELASRMAHAHKELIEDGEDGELNVGDVAVGWLGFPNGILHLESGEWRDGQAAIDTYVVGRCPDAYSQAGHWAVDKLTAHLDKETENFLWQSIGFSMRGRPDRRFLLLLGPGGGGKSAMTKALDAAFGRYTGTVASDAFTKKQSHGAGIDPSIEALVAPRRLTFFEEANQAMFNSGRLKALTGGSKQRWRVPHGLEREDYPTATIMLTANELPRVDATDEALMERMVVLPYPSIPSENRQPAMSTLWAGDEVARQALVHRVLTAAEDISEQPRPPTAVMESTVAAKDDLLGDVGAFIAENIEVGAEYRIHSGKIWQAVVDQFGEKVMSRTRVSRLISGRYGSAKMISIEGVKARGWSGIRWKGQMQTKGLGTT